MHTTTRLGLDIPDGTDEEEAYPADSAQSMGVLDNAALYLSGTLAAKPSASSTVSGTWYYCTDTGALLLCVAGAWVWPQASTELVGSVKQHSAATIPADPDGTQRWHIADGSAISRTAYASYNAQMSAAGYPWGAGDGSTTFNIPDLRGVVIVGAGENGKVTTTSHTLAANGGEETHELLAAESGVNGNGTTGTESQAHTHEAAGDSGGTVLGFSFTNTGNFTTNASYAVSAVGTYALGTETASHTHAQVARNADSAHNNLQPFTVANHIVKIA